MTRKNVRRTAASIVLTGALLGAGALDAVGASPRGPAQAASAEPETSKKGSFDITKKGSFDITE